MHARFAATSLLAAAVLLTAPVAGAVAENPTDARPGVTKSAEAKAKAKAKGKAKGKEKAAEAKARKLEKRADKAKKFVLGGTVQAVDAASSTLTFTAHGGRYKALRGTEVTVSVASDAKVTRDGVVTLAEVQAGDHVVVKAHQVEMTAVDATLVVEATVHRVAASPAENDATETETGTAS